MARAKTIIVKDLSQKYINLLKYYIKIRIPVRVKMYDRISLDRIYGFLILR